MDIKTILGVVLALVIGVAFGNYYGGRNALPVATDDAASTTVQTDLSKLSGQDFDKALIEQLIEENDNFIELADQAELKASSAELKQLSKDLIEGKNKDNEKLESLLENLFGVKG